MWRHTSLSPGEIVGAVAAGLLILWAIVRFWPNRAPAAGGRRDGWRVGHVGRDTMYYEELAAGEWRRLPISGEMLTGRAHHVIYFPSDAEWLNHPSWAHGRRDEIIARIKQAFPPPDYEHHGA